jgi:hypothetical protein
VRTEPQGGGHLYLQTNELRNTVVHYRWDTKGRLTESERHPTGGAGAGDFTYRKQPTGLLTEGANSVLITPDRSLLFAVNAGDNSVSSFGVDAEGRLALRDVRRTGNIVTRIGGTAKSLGYAPSSRTLYVLHSLGPEHIRPMEVDHDGSLLARPAGYSIAPPDKPGRVPTMIVVTPDERFLIVANALDELPGANPDGTPIFWVRRNGEPHKISANAPDPDGLAVLPIAEDGSLGDASFQDAGGSSPWCPVFLNGRPNEFLLGFATADAVSLASIDHDGVISTGPAVPADTSVGRPSELCWMAVTPDDHLVFATMTGYGYITSWRLDGKLLTVAKDPACPPIPGDGTFRGLAGIVSSCPNDMWMTPDGAYVYQLYPNAATLVGYAVEPDGSLSEVTRVAIPHNSTQGLAGFCQRRG